MKLVVDDAIPWATEAFACFGEVQLVKGRAIDRAAVQDADAVLVRTVTRIDEALLAGTHVRFVGTATAGVDHVDVAWLHAQGIAFASAAGCNATAVAEYVLTIVHVHALERDPDALRGPIAVVGLGEVGRRVTARLHALGCEVLACDPPLARRRAQGLPDHETLVELARTIPLRELDDVVQAARVLTVHVPLVAKGDDATLGMIDARRLTALPRNALVINTARGGVVDESALRGWLERAGGRAVLDVWQHEPRFDPALVVHPRVRLATPHIAGYSLEGKLRGTRMIHDALAQWLGVAPSWRGDDVLGAREPVVAPIDGSALALRTEVLRRCDPIERDRAPLRALALADASAHAEGFERLRRDYALRRELSHFELHGGAPTLAAELGALGMSIGGAPTLVLLAHGSPDPDWRAPLDVALARMRALLPGRRIELAFLDHLAPALPQLVATLVAEGTAHVRVLAAFLSPGGNHLKRDIPQLVATIARDHPATRIELVPGALGAEPEVIDALARAAARLGR